MTSRIKVNEIYSYTGAGVSFTQGMTVASGYGVTFSGDLKVDGSLNVTGSIIGDGSGLTNLPTATPSRTFSYATIL